jgi:hypothetical protein
MKLAAAIGFLTGTIAVLWAFLRSLSHGDRDFGYMEAVQTSDPYVAWLTVDCE